MLVGLGGAALFPNPVWAATYYVSSSGDDAGSGTAQATAWRTLAKVGAATFAPGDSILFQRGDTWKNGTLTVSSSGSADAKITYGAFGAGAKPVIAQEGTAGIGVMLSGKRHVIVQDFDVRRGEGGVRCLVDSAHIEILRIDVADSRGSGIVIKQSSYVLVDGCTVTRAGNNGILMHGSAGEPKVNHCTVQNCIVSDLRSNDGIVIHMDSGHNPAGSDFVLRRNISFNNPEQGFDITTGSNVLLEDNVTYGNRGGALVAGHTAHHVMIRRHFSRDEPTSGSSSLIIQVPFVTVEHSRFLGPVNPSRAKPVSIVSVQTGSESQPEDVRLTNNVFLWNSDHPGHLFRTGSGGHKEAGGQPRLVQIRRLTMRENIFASRTAAPGGMTFDENAAPFDSPGFDLDDNLYFSPEAAGMKWRIGGRAYDFAAYRAAFRKETRSVEADPKFVGASIGDFRRAPGGPAIAAGKIFPAAAPLLAPVNLSAPPLARTATTAVLLWDRPTGGADITAYEILCDGRLVGETTRLSFTVQNLTPDRLHRLAVRSRSTPGLSSDESDPVVVLTKSAGPVLDVRTLGARGDGIAKDTAAIQAAIAACPPGGTVLIPPGTYSVDHLALKSDITIEIASGATLKFLPRSVGHYPSEKITLTGPDGEISVEQFGLITAHRVKNLVLTGGGVIHGNGESWWPHTTAPRPRILRFTDCADILVQGLTLDDPPAWNTHAVYVDRAVFSGLTFRKMSTARGTNGDGLNPDSSRDVLIVGCTFANQDDSIAIKAGRVSATQPRRQRSCENITVRDCVFDASFAPGAHPLGLAIGSETCGGIRHVRVRDCVFRNAASLANIKSNRERLGAVVEDIVIENCTYTNTSFEDKPYNRGPLTIDLFYYRDFGTPDIAAPLTPGTPIFRDIHFKNIAIENPKGRFAYLCGLVEQPVRGITFEHVTGSAKLGLHGQNLDGIELRNVAIEAREGPTFTWNNADNRTLLHTSEQPAKARNDSDEATARRNGTTP
ncbi:MAG: glycosyl hydrolase family 28 protein [Opitutaceae bacterium]|nr:glycosyl hydrolase family 28 protein [Opitutaceae bacterium]